MVSLHADSQEVSTTGQRQRLVNMIITEVSNVVFTQGLLDRGGVDRLIVRLYVGQLTLPRPDEINEKNTNSGITELSNILTVRITVSRSAAACIFSDGVRYLRRFRAKVGLIACANKVDRVNDVFNDSITQERPAPSHDVGWTCY